MQTTKSNSEIKTHYNHPATDYERDGVLRAECVNVRLTRVKAGVYDVEISATDLDYIFENEVAGVVAKAIGGKVLTIGCGNGISVTASEGFRAPKGFIKSEDLK